LIGEVKNNPRITIPIFGNGDIDSPEKAVEYRDRYGVDGIMIGRASIGHPFIFNEIKHFIATGTHQTPPPPITDRVEAAREHLRSSLAWKGPWEGVVEMRRHYGNYLKGLPNVKEVRCDCVRSGSGDPGGDPGRSDRDLRIGRSGLKESSAQASAEVPTWPIGQWSIPPQRQQAGPW
jgi:tRNA-dihydrouridine synthase